MAALQSRGRQGVWSQPQSRFGDRRLPFLWLWQSLPFYSTEDPARKLKSLECIWCDSGNYGAVFDALYILKVTGRTCDWAVAAELRARQEPWLLEKWKRQHRRDRLDIVRAETFEEARYDSDDLSERLSRDEAAQYTQEYLAGTNAAISPQGLKRLLTRMRDRDARAFGRYYLSAGSLHWREEHFPRRFTLAHHLLFVKYRDLAAARGHATSRKSKELEVIYRRQSPTA